MKHIKLIIFVCTPILITVACMLLRLKENPSLLTPDMRVRSWQIESHVSVTGKNRSAKIQLELPIVGDRYEIASENFVSNGFAVGLLSERDSRKAVWSGFAKEHEVYNFYYRAQVQLRKTVLPPQRAPEPKESELNEEQQRHATALFRTLQSEKINGIDLIEDLMNEVLKGTSGSAVALRKGVRSTSAKADLLVNVFRFHNIPARPVSGVNLSSPKRTARFYHWLEVFVDGRWHPIDVAKARMKVSKHYFAWRRSGGPLVETKGASEADSLISVSPLEVAAFDAKRSKYDTQGYLLIPDFSSYPVEVQALLRILLVLPIGALVVAVIRCVVGIRTIGTFMPVLIALSFRQTELLWGILLYIAVVICSLIARYAFEHLQLLVVPRLTATLTIVVLVILGFIVGMNHFEMHKGLSVALFPIVILTMMIERISIMLEELGILHAIFQTLMSLAVAALVYTVITDKYVGYYVFTFPELLLVGLSFAILLGRFTGYRLTELYRFRSFRTEGG